MSILILWLVVRLGKHVSCLINMDALSYQPYNKMENKFKKLFKKLFIRNLFRKLQDMLVNIMKKIKISSRLFVICMNN